LHRNSNHVRLPMKKENLHKDIIGTVVAFSLLSFLFLNFIASSGSISVKSLDQRNAPIEQVVEEEEEAEEKAAPRLVVVGQLYELAKKLIPGK
jgi:hypothetical protein